MLETCDCPVTELEFGAGAVDPAVKAHFAEWAVHRADRAHGNQRCSAVRWRRPWAPFTAGGWSRPARSAIDGIHTAPSLSEGRTYRLNLVCVGKQLGQAHISQLSTPSVLDTAVAVASPAAGETGIGRTMCTRPQGAKSLVGASRQ